jgi:beta-N-acetylglucosaminidase
MSIDSLSISQLITNTLKTIDQNKALNNSKISGETFAQLLSEVLLQSELESAQNDSSNLFNGSLSTLFSSLSLDPSELSVSRIQPLLEETGLPIQETNTDATNLNANLKGVLTGSGDLFIKAGETYGVSPELLAAISMHETGNGISNAAKFKYNVAGMMGKDGLKTYVSIEESIMDLARNLKENYINEGKTSVAEIGAKYAPVGAENDPNNLNNYWVTGVQNYFDILTNKEADFA